MATRSFATFFINDQLFGLDILMIREINKHLDLSPVPHAPDYIRGLCNLRGQIVTVLDLKHRLGLGHCELTNNSHNIIIKTDAELLELRNRDECDDDTHIPDKVSLLVDGIGEVVSVNDKEIDPPPPNMGQVDGKYIDGVIKLENTLLTILSMKNVLENLN